MGITQSSSTSSPTILVVDDERSMREFLSIMLQKQGYQVVTSEHGEHAISRIERGERFQLVISDLKMSGAISGLDVLKCVKHHDPACQVVVMTAYATPETAISAIRDGAYDYLMKPFKVEEARVIVERALEKQNLLAENLYLKQALEQKTKFEDIIGKSEPIQRIFELIDRVAPTKTTILVTGESGTGKELVARAIHQRSLVADGPFVPINCGAIPESLIESELFGHQKGAFTGAIADKHGLFLEAQDGTIFLDEIGELPASTQVKLLRVLQEKTIKPVGGAQEIAVNCRIIAATNRNLRDEVEQGSFREDLYYRLNVITLELPALRERNGDVKLLLHYFVQKYAREIGRPIEGIDAQAMKVLLNYSYPGNIRELQNIVERAVTLETGTLIGVESLPPYLQTNKLPTALPDHLELPESGVDLEAMVEQLERTLITQALKRSDGNKTEAAKYLGISFRALRYRLQKYDMDG